MNTGFGSSGIIRPPAGYRTRASSYPHEFGQLVQVEQLRPKGLTVDQREDTRYAQTRNDKREQEGLADVLADQVG